MKKKITRFKTGAIRDVTEGKPDFVETISQYAEWRYANYMTLKKKKYGAGNFKKGIPKFRYLEGAERHLVKLLALLDCKQYGLPVAKWMEPDEDHACGVKFNINGFIHEEEVEKLGRKPSV